MPARAELNRRDFLHTASGIALLPNLKPGFPVSPEQKETAPDVLLLGQQVSVDSHGRVTVSNLLTGTEKQLQLPVTESFSAVRISPNGETATLWCRETNRKRSTLFTVNLTGSNLSVEKLYEKPIDDPMAYIRWSPDNQWVWVFHGSYQQSSWELFNLADRKQHWAGYPGNGPITFSPNGKWMLETTTQQRMLFDLQNLTVERWRLPAPSSFTFDTWSPDSSKVALTTNNRLYLAPMETNDLIDIGPAFQAFGFSPDNRFLVYLESIVPTKISIYDSQTQRKRTLSGSFSDFYQGAEVIFLNDSEFRLVTGEITGDNRGFNPVVTSVVANAQTGQVGDKKQIKLDGLRIFSRETTPDSPLFINPNWIAGISTQENKPGLYAISLDSGEIIQAPHVNPGWPESIGDQQLFILQKDQPFKTPDTLYLPTKEALYSLPNPETAELLQIDVPEYAVDIPSHLLAESLPNTETLNFTVGDLVTADNKNWCYLRNNKRYPIPDVDKFIKNTHFNRKQHKIPNWALDAIETGEELTGNNAHFLDWDETYKETQRDGGRMIVFASGYDTDTESHADTFDKIKRALIVKGWKYTQFLDFTYNVEVDPYTHAIVPQEYSSDDTKRYPPQNASRFNLLLTRYKKLLPRTKFILIGHSLGGYLEFHAAQNHTDAVETVVTLDSPLKGVDRSFWNEYVDILEARLGHDCGDYLVEIGDDPKTGETAENEGKKLQEKGVSIFSLTNEDDLFVRNKVSILDSSTKKAANQDIQTLWALGHIKPKDFSDLLSGHGQILKDEKVLKTITKIAS